MNINTKNLILMCKNQEIMKINVDNGLYKTIIPNLVPYQLKGKIYDTSPEDIKDGMSRSEILELTIKMNANSKAIHSYLSSRVLPLTRENAKKIYSLFNLEQNQDDYSKTKIAILCRAVSLQDDYWVKLEDDKTCWNDVNLRTNHLNEVVAQVSLRGSSLTLQGRICTPELNGKGLYAKAWAREEDGLYLHKAGSKGVGPESDIEVMVSNILDKCNVNHVKYTSSSLYGVHTCKCKCMTTENLSILPGTDFISYCNVNGINADAEMYKIDKDNLNKMAIVDYLISNSDRHGMNWGFFYDTNSMEILGCHPLFDHNNAFDEELMKDENAKYIFNSKYTMREMAVKAMKETDFHFTDTITKSDFMNENQFKSFMDRARDLNVKTIKEKSDNEKIISECINKGEMINSSKSYGYDTFTKV